MLCLFLNNIAHTLAFQCSTRASIPTQREIKKQIFSLFSSTFPVAQRWYNHTEYSQTLIIVLGFLERKEVRCFQSRVLAQSYCESHIKGQMAKKSFKMESTEEVRENSTSRTYFMMQIIPSVNMGIDVCIVRERREVDSFYLIMIFSQMPGQWKKEKGILRRSA